MAKVRVKVNGNEEKVVLNVKTVGDIREKMDVDDKYEATINGEPRNDKYKIIDGDYITFAGRARGGR